MIQLLKDLPENVVGFRGTGNITKDEYDSILIPAIKKLAENKGKISYLFVLDTDISNISAGAWYDDLKVGLSHWLQWHRMAIVSDQDTVNKVTRFLSHIIPGQVRTFTIGELEAAKKWVAQ